jgi:hypothetical protein
MTGLNAETTLSMVNIMREDAKETVNHLVLKGARHLKRTIAFLKRIGYDVSDVPCPGQAVSVASVFAALQDHRYR